MVHNAESQNIIPENRLFYTGDNYFYWGIPSLNSEEKYSLQLNYNGYTGIRKVVNSVYLNGMYTGWMEKKGIALGGSLIHDQQGDYIQFTQVRSNTAYKINLGYKVYFIPSLTIGLSSFSFGSSNSSSGGGGASTKPDITAGNWFVFYNFRWGISFDHIINPRFQPISASFTYNRKIVSIFAYQKKLESIQCENKISLLTSSYFTDKKKLFNFTEEFTIQNKLRILLNSVNLDAIGLGAGVNIDNKNNNCLLLNFIFYAPLNKIGIYYNKYELMIAFKHK